MNKTSWSVETKKIFNGILLFALAWIAYGIVEPIESIVSGVDMLGSFAGESNVTGGTGTVLTIITYILLTGIGFGYVLTINGLGGFSKILDGADKKSVASLRTAFILALVAVVLDALPLIPGIIGDIVYIVAIVLMLVAYSALKGSSTFAGNAGASVLFVAMILIMVGWVLDFIPLIGDWIEGVLTIVAYILIPVGWNKIKNAVV